MICVECSTKFCILKAIENNAASTICSSLVELFTIFGAPYVIHVDVEEEDFKYQIMSTLSKMFPAKVLLGKTSSEKFEDYKNIIACKLIEYSTINWTISIKLIQSDLNQKEFDEGISPYKLMFGTNMNSNGIPQKTLTSDLLNEVYGEHAE